MQFHELKFFLTKYMKKSKKKNHGQQVENKKIDITVNKGKGRLNPSRDKTQGKHRRKKVDEKSCVTFLLCDPGWCGRATTALIVPSY